MTTSVTPLAATGLDAQVRPPRSSRVRRVASSVAPSKVLQLRGLQCLDCSDYN